MIRKTVRAPAHSGCGYSAASRGPTFASAKADAAPGPGQDHRATASARAPTRAPVPAPRPRPRLSGPLGERPAGGRQDDADRELPGRPPAARPLVSARRRRSRRGELLLLPAARRRACGTAAGSVSAAADGRVPGEPARLHAPVLSGTVRAHAGAV